MKQENKSVPVDPPAFVAPIIGNSLISQESVSYRERGG